MSQLQEIDDGRNDDALNCQNFQEDKVMDPKMMIKKNEYYVSTKKI